MDDTTTPVVPSDPTQPVQGTDVPVGGPVVPTPTAPPVEAPTVVPNPEPQVPPVVTPPVGGTDQGGTQGMA